MIINGIAEFPIWPVVLIICYLSIAFVFIRILSYECCITHGEYHYTFLSIFLGLVWPLTALYSIIKGGCLD